MSLLEVKSIYGGYDGTDILHGVELRVEPGEIVVIVGPNGAGTSTVMKAIFGLVSVREGHIFFIGEEITNLRTDIIVRRGMCYVPQEYNVFPSLTVKENLDMGAFIRTDDISDQLEQIYQIFPPLKKKRHQTAGSLSGGERQMVAIGRALMLEPRLLMLDEPTAGLAPRFIDLIFERIRAINDLGISLLMIEQNARRALSLADRGYVMTMGRCRFDDSGPNLLANPEVAEMFLGG